MPKKKIIREPRSIEHQYIFKLLRFSGVAQGLISQFLDPLLQLWLSDEEEAENRKLDAGGFNSWNIKNRLQDIPRLDAQLDEMRYNPLKIQPSRTHIAQVSDSYLQNLWLGIDPSDVREYAPWATSKNEVVRMIYTGQNPTDETLVSYVESAIKAEKAARPRPPGRPTFKPNPPGPGAFIARPRNYPPTVIGSDGFPVLPLVPDELTSETIERQIGHVRFVLGEAFTEQNISEEILRYGRGVDRFQVREMGRVLNIPIRQEVPGISGLIDNWRNTNVSLIKNMSNTSLEDVSRIVEQAHMEGLRVEVLADQIRKRYGVSESKAALIARDQTLKLNGQITRHRQKSAGITHYRWVTSGDERVRESHQEMEGQIVSWDAPPPETGHVGMDYQCRCTSSPIIPGIDTNE